jgi:FtsZ-interacting cell division protein ZipA
MNWPVLIIVGIAALILIMFLIIRNQKDKKEFVDQLKNDYPKSKDEEGDVDIDKTSEMH